MGEFEQELEDLLAEGVESARHREAATFDELAGLNEKELVLFGAGNLGRRTLVGLRRIGLEPRCFLDSNQKRWGENLNGIPIISPEEGARTYGAKAIFVLTVWGALGADRMSSRIARLRQLGCENIVSFVPLY